MRKINNKYIFFIIYSVVCLSYVFDIKIGGIVILAFALFADLEELQKLLPVVFFFYTFLSLPGTSLSVFIPYSIIYILKFLWKRQNNFPITVLMTAFIALNTSYCIAVLLPLNYIKALSGLLGVVFAVIASNSFSEEKNYKNFFHQYMIAAILAGILSYVKASNMLDYMVVDGVNVRFNRFLSTFTDPNYTAMFYSVGFWGGVILRPFQHKSTNFILTGLMLLFVILTNSMTGLLMLFLTFMLYLLLNKSGKGLFHRTKMILGVAVACIAVYIVALHVDIPYLTTLATRINSKLELLMHHDINGFTTNRYSILNKHLDLWRWDTTLIQKLFGGICTTAIISVYPVVIHNEYITLLFNLGIVGTVLYAVFLIECTVKKIRAYREKGEFLSLILKFITLGYAFTLTMFMDFRFLLIFLL